jgi:SAM-dependent methyltransferase
MKEKDIRPEALLRQYLKLSKDDAARCFDGESRLSISCVGCGSSKVESDFVKHGFAYSLCLDCGTLYQTPRPSLHAFESFYRNSVSSNYWADVFFPAVAEARREKIFRPRVTGLAEVCETERINITRLIDVGAGYGIFLDEWRKIFPETHLVAIEPSASLAQECRAKGFEVVDSIVEEVGVQYDSFADLVVCFEVLEHAHDPVDFIKNLARLARPGGVIFVTTLCIDGFDLQTLWQQSNQISPPHHLNFLSVLGFEKLFTRAGLVDIQITTPGKLDVDIVRNTLQQEPNLFANQKFMHRLIGDEIIAAEFQKFLVSNRLSSHAWVMGRVATN